MKIVVTTSDNYHHILPTFFLLYGRTMGLPMDLVGHKKPDIELPDYVTWVSMGEQRGPKFFSDQFRPYVETLPDYFVWMMEDTFIKSFNSELFYAILSTLPASPEDKLGKVCLTNESMRREHHTMPFMFWVSQNAKYRLSTQPAIWNKEYLLKYLDSGLSVWDFETQPQQNDGWTIFGYQTNVILHNEGVTRKDIHKLNLDGIEL